MIELARGSRSGEGGHILLQELVENLDISDKAADISMFTRASIFQHNINLAVVFELDQIFGQAKDGRLRQRLANTISLIVNEPPEYIEHPPV